MLQLWVLKTAFVSHQIHSVSAGRAAEEMEEQSGPASRHLQSAVSRGHALPELAVAHASPGVQTQSAARQQSPRTDIVAGIARRQTLAEQANGSVQFDRTPPAYEPRLAPERRRIPWLRQALADEASSRVHQPVWRHKLHTRRHG